MPNSIETINKIIIILFISVFLLLWGSDYSDETDFPFVASLAAIYKCKQFMPDYSAPACTDIFTVV